MTTVKSREQCDSCWAFSTTSSPKGDDFIITGNMSTLSEQQLAFATASSWTDQNLSVLFCLYAVAAVAKTNPESQDIGLLQDLHTR